MIKLKQNTETYGDATSGYAVTLTKRYTVDEFIKEVLTRDEWGYVGIFAKGFVFGEPKVAYNKDILFNNLPDEYLNKEIKSVTASGGWSRMDWILHI